MGDSGMPTPNAEAMVLLQDDVTSSSIQGNEIASKAFNWEENRRDTADMNNIEQHVRASRQAKARNSELELKMSHTEESANKHEALKRAQAQQNDHTAWEIAAKAYRSETATLRSTTTK